MSLGRLNTTALGGTGLSNETGAVVVADGDGDGVGAAALAGDPALPNNAEVTPNAIRDAPIPTKREFPRTRVMG